MSPADRIGSEPLTDTEIEMLRRILSHRDTQEPVGRVWVVRLLATLDHERDPARCPDRCGGIVGHSGPHQSSDHSEIKRSAFEAGAAAERARLREITDKLIATVDARDEPNVHGWSRALRTALDG